MRLDFNTATGSVRIHGHMYGGRVVGNGYDPNKVGTFFLDYTYNYGVYEISERLMVYDDLSNAQNMGVVSAASTVNDWMQGSPRDFYDKTNLTRLSFEFNNDTYRLANHLDDAPTWAGGQSLGELGDDLFVGRGWQTYGSTYSRGQNEFLFSAMRMQVPEPSTVVIWSVFGLGCTALSLRRRRK